MTLIPDEIFPCCHNHASANKLQFLKESRLTMTFTTRKSMYGPLHAGVALWLAAALFSTLAFAQEQAQFVELINMYRASPGRCAGVQPPTVGALEPNHLLARITVSPGTDLQRALKDAGFQAARAEMIMVSGPANPAAAMAAIKDRFCQSLTRPEYSAVGISRNGNAWRIVLAQPLLSSDLGNAFAAGRNVLELVNAARTKERLCGNKRFSAAQPVIWNEKLAQTALAHSTDMANRNYFQHKAMDGSVVGTRAQRSGYRWRNIGENLAAGQGSAQQAVEGWLASPGHCSNIMSRDFREMGAAYAVNPRSDLSIYWTQVFGTPR